MATPTKHAIIPVYADKTNWAPHATRSIRSPNVTRTDIAHLATLVAPAMGRRSNPDELLASVDTVGADRLIPLIRRHRVAGLVWRALNPYQHALSTTFVEALQQGARDNAYRALSNSLVGTRLQQALAAEGIRSLLLKGPALSRQLYGDFGVRHAGDLDVLVDGDRLRAANECLIRLGYERHTPPYGLDDKRWPVFQYLFHHALYVSSDGTSQVELHWRLHDLPSLLPLEAVWPQDKNEDIEIGGARLTVFSPTAQLLYLCTHGARHRWYRLQWLCDLPPLLGMLSDTALSEIRDSTHRLDIEPAVGQGLALCEELWPGSVPSALADIATEWRLLQSARTALRHPADTPHRASARQRFDHLRNRLGLRRDWRYKLTCLIRLSRIRGRLMDIALIREMFSRAPW